MVTRPAKPPYSSTTIAMWMRAACMSRSSSSTGLDSGTNVGVAHQLLDPRASRLVAGFCDRRTRSLR